MVQLNRTTQKFMNRGLQRPANVLLSGPFKKVSQRLTEPVYPGPRGLFQGPISGNQAFGNEWTDEKPSALRHR
jgi:hypothetical protein